MSIISQEQKIIDLENEINFLKDRLYEEQEQNEYLRDKVDKQQKEIALLKYNYNNLEERMKDCVHTDKIKEKIKKYDKWILEGGDYTESLEAQRYALNELLEENNAK